MSTTVPNPITNAMEASLTKAKTEDETWKDGTALDAILESTNVKEQLSESKRSNSFRLPSSYSDDEGEDRVRPVTRQAVIQELSQQFEGPDGLAMSQFIKVGRSTKVKVHDNSLGARRKKRHQSRSTYVTSLILI